MPITDQLGNSGLGDLTFGSDATYSGNTHNKSATSTLTLSSSVVVNADHDVIINQGLALVSAASKKIYLAEPASNTLVCSQLASGITTKPALNILTLSQLASVNYIYGTKSLLVLNSIVSRLTTTNKQVYSNLGAYNNVTFGGSYRRSISNSLSLTSTATAQATRSVNHTLSLTQQADGIDCKAGRNTLIFDQLASVSITHNTDSEHNLVVSQSLSALKSKAVFAASVVAFNQFARGTRVLSRSITQNLMLINDLVRDRTIATLDSVLNLTQSLSKSKIAPRSVDQLLTLTSTVSVSKTYNRTVTDTLTFNNSFEKYVGISGGQTVTVPIIQVVKVKKLVILQSDNTTIVLPAPEFGDKQGNTGKLNVKRSMDGSRFIYKRDSIISKLSYDFVFDRIKAIELRQFLLVNNSKFIRMENWKGELWAVMLTNNPFTITETAYWQSPGGNKCSITLEFSGVRLN